MARSSLKTDRETYTVDFVKSDYNNAFFLGNPLLDALFTSLSALGANVWAVQHRVRVIELLMEKHGSVTHDMVEQYVPSEEETEQIMKDRDAFVAELFEPFEKLGDLPFATSMHPPSVSK